MSLAISSAQEAEGAQRMNGSSRPSFLSIETPREELSGKDAGHHPAILLEHPLHADLQYRPLEPPGLGAFPRLDTHNAGRQVSAACGGFNRQTTTGARKRARHRQPTPPLPCRTASRDVRSRIQRVQRTKGSSLDEHSGQDCTTSIPRIIVAREMPVDLWPLRFAPSWENA
ncbi:hypothetical protein ColLi_08498 [Colletotrichum liriopes]|uniref:Uncharacterized protein n=1 Tax=Colletotrichum liriopes TaxID=708192 RepID=A0AA37LUB4_9PEZI|nr:hypothetical protein ColLi_08498 [Colletotrichum liriopes]